MMNIYYDSYLVSDTRNAAVLVEAFVKPSEEVLTLPPKKLKVDPTVVDPNLPVLTAGEGTGDIIRHFNFTLKCWNMLNSTDVNQKGKYISFGDRYFVRIRNRVLQSECCRIPETQTTYQAGCVAARFSN